MTLMKIKQILKRATPVGKVFIFFVLYSIPTLTSLSQPITTKFETALKYYNEFNYAEALNKFRDIQSSDYISDKIFSTSKYYMADCLLKLNQINSAMIAFEDFTNNYKYSSLRALALYKLGTLYYEKGEYKKGTNKFFALIDSYPNSQFVGSSYFFIGDSYLKQNMFYDAEEYLGLAVSNSNTNDFIVNCIYSLGSLYEYRNNFSQAVSYYDELLTYHKSSKLAPLAQLRIGVSYFQLKEYENAILELTDSLIFQLPYKQQSEALFLVANSYLRVQKFDKAADIYKSLLDNAKTEQEKDDIKFGLAWIDFQLNNFDRAYNLFDELTESNIDSIKIKSLYWSGESKKYSGNFDEAVKIYNDYISKYKSSKYSAQVNFGLASIYYSENKKPDAEKILLHELKNAGRNIKCKMLTLLGEINLEKRELKKAANYFDSAVKIKSSAEDINQHALLGLAVTKYYKNNFASAIQILSGIENHKSVFVDRNKVSYYLAESYFAIGKFEDAIDNFNLVKSSDKALIRQSLFGLAYSYFNNKDYVNAAFYFRNYVNKYPYKGNYFNAQLRLADSYYGTKEYNKAVNLYDELFSSKRNLKLSAFSYYQFGNALYKAGNSAKAKKELTFLQNKFPKSKYADDAQFVIAWIYFKQRNYSTAIEQYQMVIDKYPETPLIPIIYYSIADSYFNQYSYENAITFYAKIIDDFPNSSYVDDAVTGIQYCYIAKDQPENAINFIDQFVKSHPNSKFSDKIMLKKGEIYFSNEKYNMAKESYADLILKYPKSKYAAEAYYWIGKSSALLSEPQSAVSSFRNVITLSPKTAIGLSAVIELNKIYMAQGANGKAIELLTNFAAKIPKSPKIAELLFLKAQAQLGANKIAEAFSTFNQIIYYYDETIFGAKAKIEMGLIELARESFENAEILFSDLGNKRNDDIGAKAQYYYGVTLFQQDKIDDAISAFVKVQSNFSDYGEWYSKALLKLGDCYVKLGDIKKAKSIFRAIYKKHKNDVYGVEAKSKLKKL